ncbi:hypothetical protein Tco_1428212 [Tanacetum coccineum]
MISDHETTCIDLLTAKCSMGFLVDLEEFCEKHYEKLLPIKADKYEYEQRKKEKLEEVKAQLDFAVRKVQGIWKITLKAKIVKGGTRGLSHESRSPASKMTTSTNLGSEDPEDHLKIFQAAATMERWVMPMWCHMFNSTLTGNVRVWFDDLPPESINSYDDQRDGESTEDFIQRYKSESGNVKGAPECMRISGFVHGITNPELIKIFHEKIPKIVDEMMQVATSFLQGQEEASNQERKKAPLAWKHQDGGHRQNFKKGGGFCSQHKQEKRPNRFTLLTKTPKEILALEKGKFKTPPSMTTPVE